jgi:hypothetical protein
VLRFLQSSFFPINIRTAFHHQYSSNIFVFLTKKDEYLFDCDNNDIYWMAARTTPSPPSQLTVVMYIIYTNLNAKQQNSSNITSSSLSKISTLPGSNTRIANSLKTGTTSYQMRERSSTILLPPVRSNFVIPIRSGAIGIEQNVGNNIPTERNVEYFK